MTNLPQNQAIKEAKVSIWLPIYIGDMLSMTTRLTTEQIGALHLLMMDFWKNGDIPNDNKIISAITRLTVNKVKQLKNAIIDCGVFSLSDDKKSLISYYLLDKKAEAKDNKDKKQERAKKAAAARWGKDKKDEQNQSDKSENTLNGAGEIAQISNAQAQNKHATSNTYAMLEQCPSSLSSSNNIYTYINTPTPKNLTDDEQVQINQTANAIREQRVTELKDWTPPTLEQIKGMLFLAGVNADTLSANRYATMVADFKAYYSEQTRLGKPLNSDEIRISKLRQWLEKDLQNNKGKGGATKTAKTKSTKPQFGGKDDPLAVNQHWQNYEPPADRDANYAKAMARFTKDNNQPTGMIEI